MNWKDYTKGYSEHTAQQDDEKRSKLVVTLPPEIKEFKMKEFGETADKGQSLEFTIRGIPMLATPRMVDMVGDPAFAEAAGGQFLGIPYHTHSNPEFVKDGIRDRVLCAAGFDITCPRCAKYEVYRNDSHMYKFFKNRSGRVFIGQVNGKPQLYAFDWPVTDDGFWACLNAALASKVKAKRVPANWYTVESEVALSITAKYDTSKGQKRAFWKIIGVFPVTKEDAGFDPTALDWDSIFPIVEKVQLNRELAAQSLEATLDEIIARGEAVRGAGGDDSASGGKTGPTKDAGVDGMDYDALCRYVAAKNLDIDVFAFDEDPESLAKFRDNVKRAEGGAE